MYGRRGTLVFPPFSFFARSRVGWEILHPLLPSSPRSSFSSSPPFSSFLPVSSSSSLHQPSFFHPLPLSLHVGHTTPAELYIYIYIYRFGYRIECDALSGVVWPYDIARGSEEREKERGRYQGGSNRVKRNKRGGRQVSRMKRVERCGSSYVPSTLGQWAR